MDLVFNQLYGDIIPGLKLKSDPAREAHLKGFFDWDELAYLYHKGYFTRRDPRFVEVFRILKAWRPYFEKDMSSDDLTKLFATQKGAMYWTGSWEVNRLTRDANLGFNWGIFYLPPIPKSYNHFGDGHPECVIGGSGTQFEVTNSAWDDTHDPATSEKLKRTISFLQFLTDPEECRSNRERDFDVPAKRSRRRAKAGAEAVRYDPAAQVPRNAKWLYTFDLRFDEILRRMLDLYLNDGISESEFMDWMESNLKTACDTIVRRMQIDLSKFDGKWQQLAPLRQGYEGLPK